MKILFIVDYYYPFLGGAEVVHQKLAEYLALKHQVTVLTQAIPHTKQEESLNGVKIIRVNSFSRVTFPYQAKKIAFDLAKGCDFVQVSTYSSAFLGAKIRKKLAIKVILLVHGYFGKFWYQLGHNFFLTLLYHFYENRLFSKDFDAYVVPSNFTATNLVQFGIDKTLINVIYHGIDNKLFHPRPVNTIARANLGIGLKEKVFLFSGRPSRMKGIETLLEAFIQVSSEIKLVLMLTKNMKNEYQRVIDFLNKNNLSSQVLIIDPVPHQDMPNSLAIADVVVVPSITEEFCFLAAESAAMHIPMVVSRVGALPEVVSGSVQFVSPRSVEGLARAIDLAAQGQFQTIPIKQFSWDEALLKYESLYKKIIGD